MPTYTRGSSERWTELEADAPIPLRREPHGGADVLVLLLPDTRVRARGPVVAGWQRIYVGDRAVGYLSGYVLESALGS